MISQLQSVPNNGPNEQEEGMEAWKYANITPLMPERLINFASTIAAEESLRVGAKSQSADGEEMVMQRVLCLNKFWDEESKTRWKAAPVPPIE